MRETGFGVVADKTVKNRLCSRGILDAYRDHDYVTPRIDAERKIVEVPRPAGVVFALTPSTNPVSTVYFKIILSLLTRNAVVVSPHPARQGVLLGRRARHRRGGRRRRRSGRGRSRGSKSRRSRSSTR